MRQGTSVGSFLVGSLILIGFIAIAVLLFSFIIPIVIVLVIIGLAFAALYQLFVWLGVIHVSSRTMSEFQQQRTETTADSKQPKADVIDVAFHVNEEEK